MQKNLPSMHGGKSHGALLGGSLLVAAVLASTTGCGSPPTSLDLGKPGSDTAANGNQPKAPNKGEELFAKLEPDLLKACGSCHQPGGPADTPFLAGPDVYKTIVSWPGVVTKDPKKSLMLTHPISGGGHSGTNLDSATYKDTLLPAVTAWLEEEARGIVEGVKKSGPSVEPVAPIIGFNAIYLDALGADFKGIAVTFNADELAKDLLSLTDLKVNATTATGVHLVHPLFTVYPKGAPADPDPTDSFSNVEQYVDVGTTATLGPGSLILTNWQEGAKLSIAFEKLEPYHPKTGGGTTPGVGDTGACKALDAFKANAQGQFQDRCFGCHGGNNDLAKAALDMSKLQMDPAAACAQIKNRVNPADPPKSQIFITTDPQGNAAHPFKFNGDGNAFNGFKGSVSSWISAEK